MIQMALRSKILLAAVACAIGFAGPALAGECQQTCSTVRSGCRDAAKSAIAGCKNSCAGAPDLRSCVSTCRGEFKTAVQTCKGELDACRDACTGTTVPPCAGDCGKSLAACVSDLRNGTCAKNCTDAARAVGAACASQPNRFLCALGVAQQLGQCLGTCADALRAGLDGCRTSAEACVATCNGGSPSGAFIDFGR